MKETLLNVNAKSSEGLIQTADFCLRDQSATGDKRAQACALMSIAISLHRLAEGSTRAADLDFRQLNPLLRKIATSSVYDPGETDLDDEQPVNLSITLGDVRTARRLLG